MEQSMVGKICETDNFLDKMFTYELLN